jgi:phytoene dehydrogenase-like protein
VSTADVVVVGAGLAGLRAAGLLCARGLDVVLLDAADRPGGRVATDEIDGFRCDRGFQVLNTSYPALRAAADLDGLALRAFPPGAAVRGDDGRLHVFANPFRRPGLLWRTATDGLLPPLGTAKLAAWTAQVLATPRRAPRSGSTPRPRRISRRPGWTGRWWTGSCDPSCPGCWASRR